MIHLDFHHRDAFRYKGMSNPLREADLEYLYRQNQPPHLHRFQYQ